MTAIRVVLIFIVGILLIILALQNNFIIDEIKVFYHTYQKVSLAVVMVYSFCFGLLVAGFFWLVSEIKLRHELRNQKKENEALLSELTVLRNLPLDIKADKEA